MELTWVDFEAGGVEIYALRERGQILSTPFWIGKSEELPYTVWRRTKKIHTFDNLEDAKKYCEVCYALSGGWPQWV